MGLGCLSAHKLKYHRTERLGSLDGSTSMADFYNFPQGPGTQRPVLARGMLIRVRKENNHLDGCHCCVLGGPRTTSRGPGFVPVAVAPQQPTENLMQFNVAPGEYTMVDGPAWVLAKIWNNLALVYKSSTIEHRYEEAAGAYEEALKFVPGMPAVLDNYIKLCMVWAAEGGDGQKLMEIARALMCELFQPISSRPEFRGLDASAGYDVVPGYDQRMVHFGVVASVDGAPARAKFSRLWVFDPDHDDLVEIEPASGIPMSAEAQEAVQRGPGTLVATDSAGGRVNLP